MIQTAEGLILRTLPLTETSLIVRWLTPEFGRISTVAKGARRPKSAFRGKLDLFYRGEFTFRRSRSSSLHTLAEVGLKETHAFLRTDLDKLRQASYAAQLVEQTTETDTPLPEIYELVVRFMTALAESPVRAETLLGFELGLLDCLGLRLDFQSLHLAPGTMLLLRRLSLTNQEPSPTDAPSTTDVTQAARYLRVFMLQQLGRLPKDRDQALSAGTSLRQPPTPPAPQVPPTSRAP